VRLSQRGLALNPTRLAASLLVVSVLGCAPAPAPAAPSAAPAATSAAPAAASGPEPAAAAAPASAPLQHVTIGVNNALSDAPFFLADERGYFREAGIEIGLEVLSGGAAMIAPLSAGQLDVGAGVLSTGLYNAIGRGVPLRAVADRSRDNGVAAIIVRRDLVDRGRVRGPADFKGLRLQMVAECISNEITLVRDLARYGLTLQDVDVTFMPFTDTPAALANGSIDVATPPEPFPARIEEAGSGVIVHRMGADIQPYRQLSVIFYSPAFAADRDGGTRFMIAYLRGVRDYHDAFFGGRAGRADVIRLLVEKTTIKQPEVYDQMVMPSLDPNGAINLQSMVEDQDYYLTKGCQQQPIDVAGAVDTSFVEAALAQIGRY
jgi:NitT/TauT family transport system substrate-binding protein